MNQVPILEMKGVTKSFPGTLAVADVDFSSEVSVDLSQSEARGVVTSAPIAVPENVMGVPLDISLVSIL